MGGRGLGGGARGQKRVGEEPGTGSRRALEVVLSSLAFVLGDVGPLEGQPVGSDRT